MKIFDELSIQKLTQISNASSLIGIILVLVGLFTLPLGLIYIAIAVALFYFDSLVNKAKNKKAQEEGELRKSLSPLRNSKHSYSQETTMANTIPFPHIPKKKTDKVEAARRLKQLTESYDLVNKTTKPDVFFGRLSFCFDCLLDLMTFKNKVFKDSTPEEEYLRIYSKIELLVNEFLDRSYASEYAKAQQLKTEKGQRSRMEKYFATMENSFQNARSFWTGSSSSPHYTGPLYTDNNLVKLKEMKTKNL